MAGSSPPRRRRAAATAPTFHRSNQLWYLLSPWAVGSISVHPFCRPASPRCLRGRRHLSLKQNPPPAALRLSRAPCYGAPMVPQPSATTPRRRYLLSPPSETRPSLLVELCPSIDETVLDEVRAAMLGLGCSNGLVLDAEQCLILHDTFASMDPSSIEVDPSKLETARLLGATSAPIEQRLERWLNALVTNWRESVPHEAWSAPLLTDVVPAAAGSQVRRAMAGGMR